MARTNALFINLDAKRHWNATVECFPNGLLNSLNWLVIDCGMCVIVLELALQLVLRLNVTEFRNMTEWRNKPSSGTITPGRKLKLKHWKICIVHSSG